MTAHEALKKYFGYDNFRESQLEIINSILDGSNVLCVLPTGGGKSICYQIPALISERFSIVVSPLIALMKDQVDTINRYYKVAAYINSSVDFRETTNIFNGINNGQIKLLFVSPEKIEQKEFFQRVESLCPDYIFVDEAHCISEWGHNFRPSYRNIISFTGQLGNSKISAFTATASPEVQDDIIKQLDFKKPVKFIKGFERKNISLRVFAKPGKKEITRSLIESNGYPAIVYCATRKQSEEVAMFLKYKNIKAEHYHAGLTTELRKIIQDDFINNRIDVIAATNAFGMGIDKPDIKNIIHFSLPASIENYYQEIGRAGRDGKEATATLIYTKNDHRIQKYLIESMYPSETEIRLIYNTICNSIGLAVGSMPKRDIPIADEILMQIKSVNISIPKFDSALKTLELSGYLAKATGFGKNFSIQIRIDRNALRNYIKNETNKTISDLLILIIRDTGLDSFSKSMQFNPENYSNILGISFDRVIEYLNRLNDYGYIEFISPSKNGVIKFLAPRVEASRLLLDFELLNSRMNNDLKKLTAMNDYVLTPGCRFAYIIKYFGENTEDYRCGKCDVCLSNSAPEIEYNQYLIGNIMDALFDLKSPIKAKDLIKLLQGTSRHPGLMKNKYYGSLEHFTKHEFETCLELLTDSSKIDIYSGTIKLVDPGEHQTSDFEAQDKKADNDDYQAYLELYNELKEMRTELSRKFNQAEELICSNSLLAEISKQLPDTPSKLMNIKGVNQRHYNKFGEEFIEIISSYKNKASLNNKPKDKLPESSLQIAELIQKKYSLDDIVSLTKLPEAVVSMQIESIIELDKSIEINSLLDSEEIKAVRKQIVNGINDIKEVKKLLPTNISYGKIRIVFAKYKSANA